MDSFFKLTENTEFIIVQFESALGNTYEVGYPKNAGYTLSRFWTKLNKTECLEDIQLCPLKWEVDVYPSQMTSVYAKDIGIAQGYVEQGMHEIFQCRLHFRNTIGWSFHFKDESGDTYSCPTIHNHWHYIDYNSKKPTIIGLR